MKDASLSHDRIVIWSPDTDVAVLAISYFHQMENKSGSEQELETTQGSFQFIRLRKNLAHHYVSYCCLFMPCLAVTPQVHLQGREKLRTL